jgi:5-formyltetrahydrofolate cyclo-ligase
MESTPHQHLTKAAVRRTLAQSRKELSPAERRESSRRIVAACRGIAGFAAADVICSYVNFREEVETTDLIEALLKEGRRVVVPVQPLDAAQPLDFAEIHALSEMVPNHFGILQPPLEAVRRVPIAAIALFLVPGLAFDPAGRRLGYGLGFYDRAFAAAAPGALKVGLAFERQLLESVPADPHDVPMDFVVTEERVIRAADGAGSPTRRW